MKIQEWNAKKLRQQRKSNSYKQRILLYLFYSHSYVKYLDTH